MMTANILNSSVFADAAVYVGTYGKYNGGSIYGKWVHLAEFDCKEDFYDYCRELHKDEKDPEFMFQDWEGMPSGFIDEAFLSEQFFELKKAAEDLCGEQAEAFLVFCERNSVETDAWRLRKDFDECYIGKYDSEEDFAHEIANDCYEMPSWADIYFDYERFARDLFMCDYWMEDGHVFRH